MSIKYMMIGAMMVAASSAAAQGKADLPPPPPPAYPPKPPYPTNLTLRNIPANWITPNDYKESWIKSKMNGVVGFTLIVNKWGNVADCEITKSSGFAELDEATCELVAVRAKFFPALDAKGVRVPANYSSSARWILPYGVQNEDRGEERVTSNNKRGPFPQEFLYQMKFCYDKEGKITPCQGEVGIPETFPKNLNVCFAATELVKPKVTPFVNEKGVAIPKTIVFTTSLKYGVENLPAAPQPQK